MTSTLQWTDEQRDQVRALLARHRGLRCLSVRQPWTDLIVAGEKPVENRTRRPAAHCVGRRIGIHASKAVDHLAGDMAMDAWLASCWEEDVYEQYHLGALIATAYLAGAHHADDCLHTDVPCEWGVPPEGAETLSYCSRWAEPDCWHWILVEPEPLDVPVPMKGMLGLWPLAKAVPA